MSKKDNMLKGPLLILTLLFAYNLKFRKGKILHNNETMIKIYDEISDQ